MAIASALRLAPFGLLFFMSGIAVNIIQGIFFALVRPISKNTYRIINRVVAELLWLQLVWLFDWSAHVKVQLYMDPDEYKLMGKEHALFIPNHRSDVDWLVGWVLAQRSGCLGSSLAVGKKSVKFLPVIGWCMWFSEFVFLERSWAKDENTLKSGYQRLKDFPRPFWLALFVEGTRFTEVKRMAAQEYAASAGLPVPRNVLVPHTKGFVSAVSNMRSFVPAIYDATVAVPKNQPSPTMLRLLQGKTSVVHVHIKRRLMKEMPETDADVAQWCRDVFVAKDALLDKHLVDDTFGDEYIQDIGRPKKSLLVVISWSVLLVLGVLKWLSVVSLWKGIAISAALLAVVTGLMHIFIVFSQSEPLKAAKVASAELKNGGVPSETSRLKEH